MTYHKQHRLVCGLLALSAALGGLSTSAHAATFYVSKASTASDTQTPSGAVNQPTKPFLTIQKAVDQAKNNSSLGVNEIIVEPGNYPEKVLIRLNGLTLKARNDAKNSTARSIIRPAQSGVWQVVSIEASDVTLRGFEIDGTGSNVDGTEDNGSQGNVTDGVAVLGEHESYPRSGNIIPPARRVKVQWCVVHDCGGGGIAVDNDNGLGTVGLNAKITNGPDYVTIEDNVVYRNSFWSRWSTSGISLHSMNSKVSDSDTSIHNYVRRNKVYENRQKHTKPDFLGGTTHLDGNGIIIDYNGYNNPQTLVENNVVYLNGGRGIHVYYSSNVTARNNSTYKNLQDPEVYARSSAGELVVYNGKNVKFTNNASVGRDTGKPIFRAVAEGGYTLSNITIRACTFLGLSGYTSLPSVVTHTESIEADPNFASPAAGNFYPNVVSGTQTVIDRASTIEGDYAGNDYYQNGRPQGAAIDRGAIERSLSGQAASATSASSG